MVWRDVQHEEDSIMPVSASLESITSRLGTPTAFEINTVFRNWDGVVGEQLAAHAQPIGMKHEALMIDVDDSRWATQLRWLAPRVVQRLNSLIGNESIDDLEIKVRRGGTGGISKQEAP